MYGLKVKTIFNLQQPWKKRAIFICIYGVCCVIFALFLFEFAYRTQIIDTYLPELRSYNSGDDIEDGKGKKTVLIMGDSFTAGTMTYAGILRKELPEYRVINSGVSGTGILQASMIAKRRFQRFKPSIFIYQVYVGNYLFDITYPVNWDKLTFLQNIYWMVSNHFRSIAFLNYRLSQIDFQSLIRGKKKYDTLKNEIPSETYGIDTTEKFSPEKYTSRVKRYLVAEPMLIENQITVQGNRSKDYDIFLSKLETLISYSRPEECTVYILVIPHCCQVSNTYLANMKMLGATFTDEEKLGNDEYPFIAKMHETIKRPNFFLLNPIQLLRDKESRNIPMYYQNDDHLTQAGQETIADFVMERVFGSPISRDW